MPARPFGRSLADFGELTEAEQKLLASCRRGDDYVIANERPTAEGKTPGNTVRARFLRFLILGGDDDNPVHEHGVRIQGAWIDGVLDLEGVASTSDVWGRSSWFDQAPVMRDAHITGNLLLSGSRVPGLAGDRLTCDAGVFLRDNFLSDGQVRLVGATIGGDLVCSVATFNRSAKDAKPDGHALTADAMNVHGNVFLNDGFTSHGVRLVNATIGGNLECQSGAFNTGAEYSLLAEGMSVEGSFYFGSLKAPADGVSLAHASVRVFVDDESAWGKNLNLGGFTYERIGGASSKDAETRRKWLDKQWPEWSGLDRKTKQFRPQPWLQLQKALTEAGHPEEARKIGIAFEDRRRYCGQIGRVASGFHWLYGFFTGYGYRPLRLLYWSLGVWLACAALYDYDAYRNKFTPATSSIYEDPSCRAVAAALKSAQPVNPVFEPPCDGNYTTFSPLVYSLNVFLPIVQLGQEAAWAPATKPFSRIWWQNLIRPFTEPASFLQLVIWLETLFGWIAGLLLVAVVSGLARKQDDS